MSNVSWETVQTFVASTKCSADYLNDFVYPVVVEWPPESSGGCKMSYIQEGCSHVKLNPFSRPSPFLSSHTLIHWTAPSQDSDLVDLG